MLRGRNSTVTAVVFHAFACFVAWSCNVTTGSGSDGTGAVTLRLETVASGLSSPVFVTSPPGDARLFVVEQPGRLRIVKNGQLVATPFLDIQSKVLSGGERG